MLLFDAISSIGSATGGNSVFVEKNDGDQFLIREKILLETDFI